MNILSVSKSSQYYLHLKMLVNTQLCMMTPIQSKQELIKKYDIDHLIALRHLLSIKKYQKVKKQVPLE